MGMSVTTMISVPVCSLIAELRLTPKAKRKMVRVKQTVTSEALCVPYSK
jgi:hypothetical protein